MTLYTADWRDAFTWQLISPTKPVESVELTDKEKQESLHGTNIFLREAWMLHDSYVWQVESTLNCRDKSSSNLNNSNRVTVIE
jgi:hypothetical protein